MTVDEIKDAYSMREVVERYGFRPNRGGFISCPFHGGDKTPSLKIYDRGFHCFGCGAHGDIIDFVASMDGVDFKSACQSLGGDHDQSTFSSRLVTYQARKRREMEQKKRFRLADKRRLNNQLIDVYRAYASKSEPLSDVWTDCYNALQYQLYVHAELNGLEERW